MAAVCLSGLIGAAALALDVTQFYVTQSTGQRIADQSALAAAFAYSQSGNLLATAQRAASSLAVVNGAGSSTVTTSIVTSPSGDGNQAVLVSVVTPVSLTAFGSLIDGLTTVNVGATSYAEIQNGVAGCLIALGSSGVSTSNGASVTATACAIASGGGVSATGASQTYPKGGKSRTRRPADPRVSIQFKITRAWPARSPGPPCRSCAPAGR